MGIWRVRCHITSESSQDSERYLTTTALEMMMVDPAYQQKGVGRLLLRWGLARADELGVDVSLQSQILGTQLTVQAVVEGSDRGRRLYASEGFDGPHYVVPVPEKFATRRKQTYWWMRRPSQIKV